MTDRLSRPSTPAAIEDDLTRLWRDAGRDGPVSRALMANLVVYRDRPVKEDVDLEAPIEDVPIDDVVRRHPARVIVLYHGGVPNLCAPIDATITILLFGPAHARVGVEKIAIRSACAEASLPSIVRRLSLGDVPTSIWWTEDLSRATPIDALLTMGRQLVYDSRAWRDVRGGVLALATLVGRPNAIDLADLNWRRLTPVRQALAQACAPPFGDVDAAGVRARIGHRPGDSALAWLLAGWLACRLGWRVERGFPVAVDETRAGDEILSVSIDASGDRSLTAIMNAHGVVVTYKDRVPPLSMAVPDETDAEAVAAELRCLTCDAGLRDALAALARRFTASEAP